MAAAYSERGEVGLRAEAASQQLLPPAVAFIRLLRPDGRAVTLASPPPAPTDDFDLSRLRAPSSPGRIGWSRAPSAHDEDVLEVASLRLANGSVIQAGMSTEAREGFLERFRETVAAILLPVALLAIAGGIFLTRRAMSPLRRLIETIRAIEAGSLKSRVLTEGSGDELDELGVLFNKMLDKVGNLVAALRGALDDAAHDLRTPLTRLRGGAELALSGGDPKARDEALADCVEECDEILAMLAGLMDVSEAEAGALKLNLEDVDVTRLLIDTADLYQEAAEEKGLHLTVAGPDGLCLRADRGRLRRAVANLVDNAVKYVPKDGSVRLSVAREGDEIVVRVSDDGPGIPPEDLPHIWDRLFRGDRSRSQRGLGLGLSMVRAVAAAHGGRAEVASRPGEGAVFSIRIPEA
ncbi:MAG: HAMP domain-containing protein [Elusimicrobia bacterium]|nr:HAMP domain-containing protein [Elusimicrobiota bacterium]